MESNTMASLFTNFSLIICLSSLVIMVVIVTIHFKFYRRSAHFMKLALQIPSPRRLPLIGTAYIYGTTPRDLFDVLIEQAISIGPVSGHWIGPEFVCVLHRAPDIEAVLSNKSEIFKPALYRFMVPWIGLGLVTSSGDRWRKNRKLLTPTFHFKVLENYVDVFNSKSRDMVKALEMQVDNLDFNIQPYFDYCVFDTICESAMSTDVNCQTLEGDFEFASASRVVTDTIMSRMFKPWLFPDIFFKYSAAGKQQKKYLDRIQQYIIKVISRKREILKRDVTPVEITSENDSELYGKTKFAFLDYLLRFEADQQNQFSEQDIQDEVKTFMAAGTDTTSASLGLIAYELSKRFDIQENIVQEITDEFGSLDDIPYTLQNLQNMKYLERVVKEGLRLYPSIPFVGRKLTQDISLPSGYVVPKGSIVLIVIYTLHRDPEIFPNPDEFNPDHFLPERIAARSAYTFCPFSAGPRNCIGQKFAYLQLKAVLITLLRKYWLLPTKNELDLSSEIVLRSKTGIHVGLKKRTRERPVV